MRLSLLSAVCLLYTSAAWSVEIEGTTIPDMVSLHDSNLQLNGAGVRSKFFFDIYIGALYLSAKANTLDEVLAMPGPKEVRMAFLYSEVSREKLTVAWEEGFRNNLSDAELEPLKDRLAQFNELFVTAHEGDVFTFRFHDDGSTRVVFNGKEAGRIAGEDFQRALLRVWLGDKPADSDLKAGMLGAS
jgi:hypothetical protein